MVSDKPALSSGELIVLFFATIIFATSVVSPPGLMNDVDGAQAQISRNILVTGDWVTQHIDGVKYMEKPPLVYWAMAVSYQIFGVHDWAARIPISLSAILLCWLVARMAGRAMGERAGMYAGLSLATSVGLWLFTRILIPDIMLTLAIAVAMWGFFRALDDGEAHPRRWALAAWAAIGAGILAKGLIASIFPFGAALLYLGITGLWRRRETWKRLSLPAGLAAMLAVAAPWHVIATIRNPPYFDFTMHGGPGQYRGFFWFYFINEHVLRFLNLRYPHDYNTVPPPLFWLLHFAWFFPWSPFLIRAGRLSYLAPDPASRLRLLALCQAGVVLAFFTFSTTQEYYSMPAYPALAILIGSAMAESGDRAWRLCTRTVAVAAALALSVIAFVFFGSLRFPAAGDISRALDTHSSDYTLSLDHVRDLTLASFAYLRLPLAMAGLAALIGATGGWRLRKRRAAIALACMMTVFFQAARLGLIAFDPYLGSRPIAEALNHAPPGGLIIDDAYYEMSSVLFYSNHETLILNGRFNNLEYGSYAPGAPDVFIGDAGFVERWRGDGLWYVAAEDEKANHLRDLVGEAALHRVAAAGGKTLYVNRVVAISAAR